MHKAYAFCSRPECMSAAIRYMCGSTVIIVPVTGLKKIRCECTQPADYYMTENMRKDVKANG